MSTENSNLMQLLHLARGRAPPPTAIIFVHTVTARKLGAAQPLRSSATHRRAAPRVVTACTKARA